MSRLIDLTGKRFERLVVLGRAANSKSGSTRWLCQCDCGNTTISDGYQLRNCITKSCGCYSIDNCKKNFTKHGLANHRLRYVFNSMHSRCENSENNSFTYYGGRGIKVCDEWARPQGFIAFYNWSIENGFEQGLQIDRIDVNKGYSPDNCRWVTPHENSLNRRVTLMYEYKGENKPLYELAEQYNIPYKTLFNRVKYLGWDIDKALSMPVRKNKIKKEVLKHGIAN